MDTVYELKIMSSTIMPKIIAHRGASGSAPENTLAAIRLAAEHGATWIEIDVNISSDGVPVLFHDDGLSPVSYTHLTLPTTPYV